MALFMDFHEDLKLPAEAIAHIAEDASYGVLPARRAGRGRHPPAPRRARRALGGRAPSQQPDLTAAVGRGRQVAAGRATAWPGPAPAQAAAAPALAQVPPTHATARSTSRPAPNN
jgi:hypothetical protein